MESEYVVDVLLLRATCGLRYQYPLGPDLLVAPVVDKGGTEI
ncbi:hypothetical protein SAMN04488498_115118 [Mesorhizobium albiziae]|uniref:Uncharacterized protein n=1 Tax=Neomesorhizobium albiziae TaxID=335020 RepID=A0A1I4D1U2_9HYPH|nr:hypothetical protein [Mesorhizobium albiziae]SFK87508.1 hypothetical protein SAMN04488498_115118 [Mesorhizobium albiziae]